MIAIFISFTSNQSLLPLTRTGILSLIAEVLPAQPRGFLVVLRDIDALDLEDDHLIIMIIEPPCSAAYKQRLTASQASPQNLPFMR
jgi:hypothetical protein